MLVTAILVRIALAIAEGQVNVLWQHEFGLVSSEGLIASFSKAQVQERTMRLAGDKRISLGVLKVYASEGDRRLTQSQGGTDCSFETWRDVLRRRGWLRAKTRCADINEALKIGSGVVLRHVDSDCETNQVLLGTQTDPTVLALDGLQYKILDIVITPTKPRKRQTGPPGFTVLFFVRTDAAVNVGSAKKVLTYIRPLVGDNDIMVTLRNDAWFATHCEFPTPHLFEGRPVSIPDKQQYIATREATCVSLSPWPIRCY